jgi:hypothetical protein
MRPPGTLGPELGALEGEQDSVVPSVLMLQTTCEARNRDSVAGSSAGSDAVSRSLILLLANLHLSEFVTRHLQNSSCPRDGDGCIPVAGFLSP